MAVYAYLGLPGSGKSFHVVKDTILKALHDGRRVFHNLPLNFDVIEGVEFHIGHLRTRLIKINSGFLHSLHRYEKVLTKSLLVIDEAHEAFWTGDKIKDAELRNFWTFHRHWKMDIVVLTQDADNLAKIIKGVISLRYEFRNMGFLGFRNSYEVRQYEGISSKVQVGIKRGRFDKKFFPYYESVSGGGASSLFKIKAPLNFSIYKWLVLLIGGPVLIVYLFLQLSFFGGSPEGESQAATLKVGRMANEDPGKSVIGGDSSISGKTGKSNRASIGRNGGQTDPRIEKIRFNSEDQGKFNFYKGTSTVNSKQGIGDGGRLDRRGGTRSGMRSRDLIKEFYSGLVMSIASEDIKDQDVKPGRYKVNGAIGMGSRSLYVMKSMDGVSARFYSERELLIGSIVRVY